jgi:hypothetical protein
MTGSAGGGFFSWGKRAGYYLHCDLFDLEALHRATVDERGEQEDGGDVKG